MKSSSHVAIPKLLAEIQRARGDSVTLVQVGANDGKVADPVTRSIMAFNWRALLIEPVPYYFDLLRDRYEGLARVTLVRKAVDHQASRRTMYVVDPANQSPERRPWWMGLASFYREHLVKYKIPADCIMEVDVETAPLRTIMKDEKFDSCDVLCIDVEGHEFEVIDSFPFELIRPTVVVFEAKHLALWDYASIEMKLDELGYIVKRMSPDAIAIQRSSPLADSGSFG